MIRDLISGQEGLPVRLASQLAEARLCFAERGVFQLDTQQELGCRKRQAAAAAAAAGLTTPVAVAAAVAASATASVAAAAAAAAAAVITYLFFRAVDRQRSEA
jgi:hypothetical protein